MSGFSKTLPAPRVYGATGATPAACGTAVDTQVNTLNKTQPYINSSGTATGLTGTVQPGSITVGDITYQAVGQPGYFMATVHWVEILAPTS